MGRDCEGLEGQLGSGDFIQMAMGTIWDSSRGPGPMGQESGSVSGKGEGCVKTGLKPDGRPPR